MVYFVPILDRDGKHEAQEGSIRLTDFDRLCVGWKGHEVRIAWTNANECDTSLELASLDGLG